MRAIEQDVRISTAGTSSSERSPRDAHGATPLNNTVRARSASPNDFSISLAWTRPLETHEEQSSMFSFKGRGSEGTTSCSGPNSVLLTDADASQSHSTLRVCHPRVGTSSLSSSRGLVTRRPITTVLSLESRSLSLVSGELMMTHPTNAMEQQTFAFGGVFDERAPTQCCSDGPSASLATAMSSDGTLALHPAGTNPLLPVSAGGYPDHDHPLFASELTLE